MIWQTVCDCINKFYSVLHKSFNFSCLISQIRKFSCENHSCVKYSFRFIFVGLWYTRKYFNMPVHEHISTQTFITIVLLLLCISISLYYLATIIYIYLLCNIPQVTVILFKLRCIYAVGSNVNCTKIYGNFSRKIDHASGTILAPILSSSFKIKTVA